MRLIANDTSDDSKRILAIFQCGSIVPFLRRHTYKNQLSTKAIPPQPTIEDVGSEVAFIGFRKAIDREGLDGLKDLLSDVRRNALALHALIEIHAQTAKQFAPGHSTQDQRFRKFC